MLLKPSMGKVMRHLQTSMIQLLQKILTRTSSLIIKLQTEHKITSCCKYPGKKEEIQKRIRKKIQDRSKTRGMSTKTGTGLITWDLIALK